ncbi:box C/D snoRNA protein 1 [Cynoglossus semilaevis]|uniref:Box C/D snoRNA protein 1 n=1 Tax=Cynoglossus semilaevis TaxID=244447 RepID=A0A3P8WPR0_CYNSE|nr:box C/D snoRNA protein 1 [Cynoglossus semilaevis]
MPRTVTSGQFFFPDMCDIILPATNVMSADMNDEHDDEPRAIKRKISLSNCVVCQAEEAKYRCPACQTQSCSLSCVKRHKEESGCSGVRDKTAYVALSEFDEMALLSDYRFLEDTGRFADGASRDKIVKVPHSTFKAKKLANFARKMNITLRFLPITFSKSRENSTIFVLKEKRFLWHLKLLFPQSSSEFSQRRVADGQTLEQILSDYIHPTESDPVTRQKLKVYVQFPFDHLKVFMKVEGRKANSLRYHELDLKKSLRDNLSYKILIEYPVLHVVLKEHWKDFPQRGPADATSARKDVAVDGKTVDATRSSPCQQQETPVPNIWTETPKTKSSPEVEPPQKKRAKTESQGEEIEEGEISDSSDEDEDGNEEKTTGGDDEISADKKTKDEEGVVVEMKPEQSQ